MFVWLKALTIRGVPTDGARRRLTAKKEKGGAASPGDSPQATLFMAYSQLENEAVLSDGLNRKRFVVLTQCPTVVLDRFLAIV